jgi:hypothetical protein
MRARIGSFSPLFFLHHTSIHVQPLLEEELYTDIHNRSVFTDALAPPPSKPAPKPWDRAPVPAHAPRLAGQKIWKKAGLRSHSAHENQENEALVQAQAELKKGGQGMRKRARVVGEKRSGKIGEVGWMVKSVSPQKKMLDGLGERESPRGERTARKRTNADLVITPRKGERVPLNDVGNGPGKNLLLDGEKRIPLNDVKSSVKGQDGEKPRRRKSLRRSSRRLTIPAEEERRGSDVRVFTGGVDFVLPPAPVDSREEATTLAQSTANAVEETAILEQPITEPEAATNNDDGTSVEPQGEEVPEPEEPKDVELITSQTAEIMDYTEDSTPETTDEAKDVTEDEALSSGLPHNEQSMELVEEPEHLSADSETSPEESTEDESVSSILHGQDEMSVDMIDDSEQYTPLSNNLLVNETEVPSHLSDDPPDIEAPLQEQEEHSPVAQYTVQLSSAGELKTPKSQSTHQESVVLRSIEEVAEPNTPLPSKIPITPRSRKGTVQRRGTRRSTRISRASSVQSDDQTRQEASMSMPETMPVLSTRSASPRKRSARKQARTQDQPVQDTLLQTPTALRSNPLASPKKISPAKQAQSSPRKVPSSPAFEVVQTFPEVESTEPVEDNEATSALDAVHNNENGTTPEFPQEDFRNTEYGNQEAEMQDISQTQTSDDPFEVAQEILTEPNEEIQPTPTETLLESVPETAVEHCLPDDTSVEGSSPEAQLELVADFDGRGNYLLTSADAEAANAPLSPSENHDLTSPDLNSDDTTLDALEIFEPIVPSGSAAESQCTSEPVDELPETSTPNPTTTELVEAISENAPQAIFNDDDTDMLRNFLTRVKANKAAKAEKAAPKRKRSLPHSPLRIPLGDAEDGNLSPSPKDKDELDVSLPIGSPAKRRRRNEPMLDEDVTEPRSTRRSARTRLPVKATTAPPSLIPLRRLGQEGGDNTITVRRTEEKELAALTRVNTRKNKGGASSPADVLAKKAEEKDDPASRQRALKEVFDEKEKRHGKSKKSKTVVWAEELAQYQTADGRKVVVDNKQAAEPEKEKEMATNEEKKKSSVPRPGHRSSKIALGMAANGTPAPKRKRGGRS